MAYKIPVYILAGGQSSRFGADKAQADVRGRPLILHVAEQWQPWAARLVVVADREAKYEAFGLQTITDRQLGLGPLGGLATALEDCGAGWLLLAACDAIVLNMGLAERLLAEISGEAKVIALKGAQWETMPALYHCSILPEVRACVAEGRGALWKLIERVPHKALAYPKDAMAIAQINTPEDLQRFLAAGRQ